VRVAPLRPLSFFFELNRSTRSLGRKTAKDKEGGMLKHFLTAALIGLSTLAAGQTADDLVSKNLQAKGGIDSIKALKSLKMTGRFQQGDFTADVGQESRAPNFIRETFSLQGMTQIQAYDGTTGWQISPFQGRKDPELLGEDDLRNLTEDADFYGPLVDYREKGNTVEYLGAATVDGDDAYRLKVTLKNGDIFYYYLDPDTSLEIRIEKQQFIRGSVRESLINLGSYKLVNGVYLPTSLEVGDKRNPNSMSQITYSKIEGNVDLPDSEFKMPNTANPAAQKQAEEPKTKVRR
jgi:hypothetical protein